MLFAAALMMGQASPSWLSCGTPPPEDCSQNLQVGFANVNGLYRKQPELNLFSESGPRMAEANLNTLHVWARGDRYPEGTNADQKWGPIASPADFVKTPFVDEVFQRDNLKLITLGVWAHKGVNQPIEAPSADPAQAQTINQWETEQHAELTKYLRTRFKNTGKTFVLKGWETDWILLGTQGECLSSPDIAQVNRMIEWMRAKQEGVNQGRAQTPDSDVSVYFAVEVNRVQEALGKHPVCSPSEPRLRMAHLLPFIGPDMITYSAWDSMVIPPTESATRTALEEAVDFLLDDNRQFDDGAAVWPGTRPARRPADPQGLGSARLIISEMGVPESERSEEEVRWRLKTTLEVARDKKLKAAYFWNLYDNECDSTTSTLKCRGFWLYKPGGDESIALKLFRETVTWCSASSENKRDIAFVFDLTSSMRDDINNVKAASIDIVNAVAASSSDYRVAIVGYQDYPTQGDYPYQAVLGFTNDKAAIINAIQALHVYGGGDAPESTLTALVNTLRAQGLGGWRDGAAKSIIHITDAPPHDPEVQTGYTAISVTSHAYAPYVEQLPLPASNSLTTAGPQPVPAGALTPSVRIFPIVVGDDPATLESSTFFATRTKGRVFTADTAQEVVDAILDAVTTPPASTFRVHGTVGISGSDMKGANRLTRGPCAGQPFMTATALNSTIDVDFNGTKATWDCTAPEYSFGELPFTPGTKTFTFDPPGPYKCEWYVLYGTRDSESFTANPDGTCSVTVGMSKPGELFVWFLVKPIALYKVTGAVGLFGSDMTGANRFTRGPCPGTPFNTSSAINVTQADLGAARWDCAAPSFYFGDTLGQGVPLGTGTRSFTFTPPPGYRCNWYSAYGTKTSESFSTSGNSCTITLGLSANPGDIFLWYYVQPTSP
ncbi:vWA domain-containing protein [Archangium lansingense]|uniref:vWA domain-containing protein n=1 Tax=Archangium lansingense TaxID=2995310 RepID=UPI003B764273